MGRGAVPASGGHGSGPRAWEWYPRSGVVPTLGSGTRAREGYPRSAVVPTLGSGTRARQWYPRPGVVSAPGRGTHARQWGWISSMTGRAAPGTLISCELGYGANNGILSSETCISANPLIGTPQLAARVTSVSPLPIGLGFIFFVASSLACTPHCQIPHHPTLYS